MNDLCLVRQKIGKEEIGYNLYTLISYYTRSCSFIEVAISINPTVDHGRTTGHNRAKSMQPIDGWLYSS